MDPLAIASLVVFGASLVNAGFVLFSKPHNLLKCLWGLISLIVGVVGIHLFYLLIAVNSVDAYIHSLTLNTAIIFIPIFFFHFSLLLTNRLEQYKNHLLVYYVVTFVYMVFVLIYPSSFIPSVGPVLSIKYYCRSGPLFYFLPVWLVFLMGHGLLLVYRNYRGGLAVRRNQLKYFFVGCLLGLIGSISAFLPAMNINIYPWGIYLIPLCLFFVAYAILKHHLMDIQIVLRKSLIYTFVISLALLFAFVLTFLVQRFFRDMFGVTSWVSSAIVIALVGMVFIPIYQMVQNIIDRIFYKGSFPQIVQENKRLHEEILAVERYKTFTEISKSLVSEMKVPLTKLKEQSYNRMLQEEVSKIEETLYQLEQYSQNAFIETKVFNVIASLEEVVNVLSQTTSSQKIGIFRYYQADDNIKINGDSVQFKRALTFLFDHCLQVLKHEQERGDIFITVEYDRVQVSFSIRHSGKGLTKMEIEKLFTPFFKTDHYKCGLHLILTQSIVAQHGGKIWVESDEDSGTEFLVELPLN